MIDGPALAGEDAPSQVMAVLAQVPRVKHLSVAHGLQDNVINLVLRTGQHLAENVQALRAIATLQAPAYRHELLLPARCHVAHRSDAG